VQKKDMCRIPVRARMRRDENGHYDIVEDHPDTVWADIPAAAIAQFLIDHMGIDAIFREEGAV
jgi:hypothetical protein